MPARWPEAVAGLPIDPQSDPQETTVMPTVIRHLVALLGGVLFAAGACAQAFPGKPVKIVVNFAVGGPADLMARVFAEHLTARVGQPVIVEALPGANGNLGAQAVSRASADGHTLLLTAENVLTVSPLIYSRMGFDPHTDLEPVSLVGAFEQVLVVPPGKGMRTVADLVARAKAENLAYASAGIGSPGHLAFLSFAQRAGITASHIPYKGGVPAVTDLIGAQVDAGFVVIGGVRQHLQAGKLVALAVSGKERSPELPRVPTLSETGYPNFSIAYGYLLMLPKGATAPVKRYWQEQMREVLQIPDVVERLKALDTRVINGDAVAARSWVKDAGARWRAALGDGAMKLD
jgi:tripartite-type tricarboxylate transporter receptor subunit TctC